MNDYLRIKYEFDSEEEKKVMIEACEHRFGSQIDAIMQIIKSHKYLSVLTLCGPTCSGKTTICRRLTESLSGEGRCVKLISIDDFFKDREELNRSCTELSGKIDYDSPSALDLDGLGKFIDDLFGGRDAYLPVYDFNVGKRASHTVMRREDGDILLFEGIQALYPEFTRLLAGHEVLSIYAGVEDGYNVGGVKFSPREIRFARRIVRDFKFRSSPPAFTFYLWDGVVENEDKNILPNRERADVFVNTALPYELSAIKRELLSVLEKIPSDSEFYDDGKALARKFEKIEEIDTAYVPKESFFREFIG